MTRSLAALLLMIAPSIDAFALNPSEFLARNSRPQGDGTPYRIFVPASYRTAQRLPLIVFLNGSGQVGDDDRAQITQNTDSVLDDFLSADHLQRQPVLFVAPQSRWEDWDPAEIAEVVASVRAEYSVDAERIYLTGLSSGGSAVWDTLKAFPDLFAAAVPLCGSATLRGLARIARIPLWIFHGANDHETDPLRGDGGKRVGPRKIVRALQQRGGSPRYTEYPDLGHVIWDRAYAEPALFGWLVGQRRGRR